MTVLYRFVAHLISEDSIDNAYHSIQDTRGEYQRDVHLFTAITYMSFPKPDWNSSFCQNIEAMGAL